MFEIHIGQKSRFAEEERKLLADQSKQLFTQRVKVYRTYVCPVAHYIGDPSRYIFSTTSKDVHLMVGTLDMGAREALAILLLRGFRKAECTELLLYDEKDEKAFLVTTTLPIEKGSAYPPIQDGTIFSRDGVTFTFSPAH